MHRAVASAAAALVNLMSDAPQGGKAADASQLRHAIAAIEAQRGTLGDSVTDLALAPLKQLLCQAVSTVPLLRRAQVTVLFADIVDSTALASRLDPEDVLAVFGRMLERAAACVRARGGRVLRYTGDGLKAGFGTHGTSEDDAAQALLAGLDILAAAREHASWAASEHGVGCFSMRAGAHTGEVAMGAGFESDNTLSGDTVNIAARMEQTAPPGALRISARTWTHVRGRFDVEAAPLLHVKGIDLPLQTYLVRGTAAGAPRRSSRGIDGLATRMVGRGAELGRLQDAFHRLLDGGRFAAITVVADAGIGKTRLLDEFTAWRMAQAHKLTCLHGHTTQQTEGRLFGLLRDIIARYLGIAEEDDLALAQSKLERGIVPLFIADQGPEQAQAHAHLLGHLVGIDWAASRHIRDILDDPRQLRDRALQTAAQVFRRLAIRAGGPLLLQLEDLHWADAESLDLLQTLVRVNRDVPMLLLSFARPGLFVRRPDWGDGASALRIDLHPLGEQDRQELATELLRKLPAIAPDLLELLTGPAAAGNPFYMEELLRMLIDRGAVQTGAQWRVNVERLNMAKLPSTLTGVLQARLDGLGAAEKRALQLASVVGRVFSEQALRALDATAITSLPALVREGLVLRQSTASADGMTGYAFQHQLLQQVAYDTMLKQDRRECHSRLAHRLAGLTGKADASAGDLLGVAAEHFEKAEDAPNAIEFHARAAARAGDRFSHERVLRHVTQALSLLGPTGPGVSPAHARTRWTLLTLRENALYLLARRDDQAADIGALDELAELLDDDRRRAYAAWCRSRHAMRISDLAPMEDAARLGMACALRAGDDVMRLRCLRLLSTAWGAQGRFEAGRSLARQGLEEARRLGLARETGGLYNVLLLAARRLGELSECIAMSQLSLQASREARDSVSEGIALLNLGVAWLNAGDLEQARRHMDAALAIAQQNGDRVSEGTVLGWMSRLSLWMGDPGRALAMGESARDISEQAQARDMQVRAELGIGEAALSLRRLGQARKAYTQAHQLALKIGYFIRHDAEAGLARVALAEGHVDAAMSALDPLLRHVAAGGRLAGTEHARRIELTCHMVLRTAADPRARDWLERAHEELMAQAQALTDAGLRERFLQDIPCHRKILRAWEHAHAVAAGSHA